ncbi:MAG: hypothetical protein LBV58_01460 [Acholeplasmatales bacterium]|nr:hypothetical protein [Acholeplasmatales bacterium]
MFNSIRVASIIPELVSLLIVLLVISGLVLIFIVVRTIKCPVNKILVIYGKLPKDEFGRDQQVICMHGGKKFIWPIVQAYKYLDLQEISILVDLKDTISNEIIGCYSPLEFIVAISTEKTSMVQAAINLIGLPESEIYSLAKKIIVDQILFVIKEKKIDKTNIVLGKFIDLVSENIEKELKKIGLSLISVKVTDSFLK